MWTVRLQIAAVHVLPLLIFPRVRTPKARCRWNIADTYRRAEPLSKTHKFFTINSTTLHRVLLGGNAATLD